jgi:hypothetical protein
MMAAQEARINALPPKTQQYVREQLAGAPPNEKQYREVQAEMRSWSQMKESYK